MTEQEVIENVDVGTSPDQELVEPVVESPVSDSPMEVISVDELIDRLTSSGESEETIEAPIEDTEPEEMEPTLADRFFAASLDDTSSDQTVQLLTEIKAELVERLPVHPLMTTDFADYTVTEGLLLLALLFGVGKSCIKMLKGAFSWLLW